jgi:hypothetical protein
MRHEWEVTEWVPEVAVPGYGPILQRCKRCGLWKQDAEHGACWIWVGFGGHLIPSPNRILDEEHIPNCKEIMMRRAIG